MDLTPPLAPSDPKSIRVGLPGPVDGYLARLADEQARFLSAWTDANRSLHPSSGQVAKVASIQLRLTQEFLDAQRAIVRRRAETDVAITAIASEVNNESAALLDAARARASVSLGTPMPPPAASASGALAPPARNGVLPMPLPAPAPMPMPAPHRQPFAPPAAVDRQGAPSIDDESLARLIDGVFESSEPDGVAARRELRELLDGWWRVENQEAQAAIDDAQARAAMHLHLARVEADELARFTPPSPAAPAAPAYVPRSSSALPAPLVTALDSTDHEHLDDVLAHLLDEFGPAESAVERAPIDQAPATPIADGPMPRLPEPDPAAPDSLNDRTAAPQEAFDTFWGTFTGSRKRTWLFPQLLLPAVTVIAVLALVLAVVG
jgi:hypothetical protein